VEALGKRTSYFHKLPSLSIGKLLSPANIISPHVTDNLPQDKTDYQDLRGF